MKRVQSLSPFLSGGMCLEHTFLVRSMMEEAQDPSHCMFLQKECCTTETAVVCYVGQPDELLSIIVDIYECSSFKDQAGDAETEEIRQRGGSIFSNFQSFS